MKKIAKKKKGTTTIEEIETLALKGKDTSMFFSTPKRMPPREVQKISVNEKEEIVKVNVDVTASFLSELDSIALFLNISRQAVMKMFLKDGVDRHFIAKQARKAIGE